MKMASLSDKQAARCWEEAKWYLQVTGKGHVSRMIEYSIKKKDGDTKEPEGAE